MRRLKSSWTSTLAKLGFQTRKRRKQRLGGNFRRAGMELLEPRELLSNTPWMGTDKVIADFDGDGNLDRLSSSSPSGTAQNETWFIDTKTSAAANTTEAWRVTRGDGAPPTWTLPQQFVTGDFNDDGRSDILGRGASGPWYMIQSRGPVTVGGSAYAGEFVISTWGNWGTTGDWSQPVVGDYDGDGRDDVAAFTAAGSLRVAHSTGTKFDADGLWGQPTSAPDFQSIVSGDFNGDGRDDVWFKKASTNNWAVALSDGAKFIVIDPTTTVTSTATTTYKGDFDGDGADELLGWNNGAGRWDVLDYTDQGGAVVQTTWGTALGLSATLQPRHIGDVNHDGRDDIVAYDTAGAGSWKVALSQKQSNGTNSFVTFANSAADWNAWFSAWDWGPMNAQYTYLNIDAPHQRFINAFQDVYNTIALDFHPGFMKSPSTASDTEAGNPWEQAALLVDKLEGMGFTADIATGQVRASFADVTKWIGAKDWFAAYSIITSAFDPAATYTQVAQTITFSHVWVSALLPTVDGMKWVDLDPSWKFKDIHSGIELTPGGGSGLLTSFDAFAKEQLFKQQGGKFAKTQLPIEAYEDDIMQHLVDTATLRGNSLADVQYDGPIIARQFEQIPLMPRDGLEVLTHSTTYANFATIAPFNNVDATLAQQLTHRLEVKVEVAGGGTLIKRLIVPISSLDATVVWYSPGATAGKVVPHLKIAGQDYVIGTEVASGTTDVTITVKHLDPTNYQSLLGSNYQHVDVYTRKAGQIVVVGLDANQYSSRSMVQLLSNLNTSMATIGAGFSSAIDKDDIDEVLAYVSARYWDNFNRGSQILTSLSHTVDVQQRVGSGVITANSTFNANTNIHAHLDVQLVPDGMFVDLKNGVVSPRNLASPLDLSSLNMDVVRLALFNGSALEHAVLEEVINSSSISTVSGLQLYLDSGQTPAGSTVRGLVVERNPNDASFNPGGSPRFKVVAKYDNAGLHDNLSEMWTEAQLRAALLDSFEATVLDKLNSANALNRLWIPTGKTTIAPSAAGPGWDGTVYIHEQFVSDGAFSLSYSIQRTGELPANGAYNYGAVAPPKPVQLGTFTNQTFAGDPVNIANGNMFRDETDFTFANSHLPLDFKRHYDSQNTMDVGLGVGWVHNFTNFIYQEPGQTLSSQKRTWLRGNGERKEFTNNTYQRPNTMFGEIVASGGNLLSYKDKDGTEYVFDSVSFLDSRSGKQVIGRVTQIRTAGGETLSISYESNTSTRVLRIASLSVPNRFLDFSYADAATPLSSWVQAWHVVDGRAVATWTYQLASNLTGPGSSDKRLIEVRPADQIENATRYSYYTSGPLATKGLVQTITEPNGEFHTYEYYANGRVFRVLDGESTQEAYSYNLFRNLTTFTDKRGDLETYIHQDNGLLAKQIHDDRSRLEFTWGADNSVEEFLMNSSTDEQGAKETFAYVQPGQPNYHPGDLKQSVAKDGLITQYEYSTTPLSYISGLSKIIVDPTGSNLITEYTRDTSGRVLSVKDAEGNLTKYEYFGASDAAHLRGLLKSQILPKGVTGGEAVAWQSLASAFNVTGSTLSIELLTSNDSTWLVADAIRIDRIDTDGAITRVADATTIYDDTEFRVGSVTPNAITAATSYSGSYVRFANSTSGQVAASWVFKNLQPGKYRISATWPGDPANDSTATYRVYDGLPNGSPLLTVNDAHQNVSPASFRSYQTVYEYDTAGNVVAAVTEGLPPTRRTYDKFGNVVYEQDPTGVTTYNEYDRLGRLVKSSVVDAKTVDFAPASILRFHGPNASPGNITNSWDSSNLTPAIGDNGRSMRLIGDSRKAVEVDYQVTANTILEFDFNSTALGSFQGLGLGNNLYSYLSKGFKLGGTTPTEHAPEWTANFASYATANGTTHYRIPVGQYLSAGEYEYLVFVHAGGFGDSSYSNVRMFEVKSNELNPKDIQFNVDTVHSYNGAGGWDLSPNSWESLDHGNILRLYGGARKGVDLNYQINANSVIEFDFEATGTLSDAYGIGLSNDLNQITALTFALAGTISPSWLSEWNWNFHDQDYQTGDDRRHFRIPIGQFVAAGNYKYLAFINYDGTQPTNSYFSNVRVYDAAVAAPGPQMVNFTSGPASNVQSYNGSPYSSWDFSPNSWQVLDNGSSLYLYDGARKGVEVNYDVTRNTILEFDFTATGTLGDLYGVGISNDLNAPTTRSFAVAGTHPDDWLSEWNWKYKLSDYVPGATRHVKIDLGTFIAPGAYRYLAFINYDDANLGKSTFSNVVLSENAQPVSTITFPTVSPSSTEPRNVQRFNGPDSGSWDVSNISPVISNGGKTIQIHSNSRKAVGLNYYVTADTVLEFDYAITGAAQFQGIGIGNSLNAYLSQGFILSGSLTSSFEPEWTRDFQLAGGVTTKHVILPIGKYLAAGDYEYLVFVNIGAGQSDTSSFSNIRVYDPVGVSTTALKYDASGRVSSTTDALGRRTTNRYDKNGRLVQQTFADGTFTTNEYDAAGNRVATTDELDRTTHYIYDNRNRLIQSIFADGTSTQTQYDGAGRVVKSIDELGHTTQFIYDVIGRLLQTRRELSYAGSAITPIVFSNGYDRLGNRERSVDANGNLTTFVHDKLGRVTETRVLKDGSTSAAPVSLTSTIYDANGNIFSQTAHHVADAVPPINFTNLAPGSFGGPGSSGPGTGNDPSFNNSNSLQKSLDGLTLSFAMNSRRGFEVNYSVTANTILEFDFEASNVGNLFGIGVGNHLDQAPDKAFTLAVRPGTSDPTGNWTSDYNGYDVSAPDGPDGTRHYKIALGRYLLGFEKYLLFVNSDPNGTGTSKFSNVRLYDSDVASINFTTTPFSDFVGNGTAPNPTVTAGGRTIGLTGDMSKAIAANYNVTPSTILEFDFKGTAGGLQGIALAQSINDSQAKIVKLLGSQTGSNILTNLATYDATNGRYFFKVAIGQYIESGLYGYLAFINDNGGTSEFSDVRLYENPNSSHVVQTAYDAFGRPVQTTNADGTTTSTIYDAAGRVRYTFDELGRKTELVYDQFGRLVQTKSPDPDGLGPQQSPYTRYVRNAAGNVTQQWDYFATNGATNIEFVDRFLYDARNQLATTFRKDNTQLDSLLDVAGQRVATIDALRNSTYTTYDDRGRTLQERLADPDGNGKLLAPVSTHQYDAAGNRVATTDPLGNSTFFAYDSLNRLRTESHYESVIADDSNVAAAADVSFTVNTSAGYLTPYYITDSPSAASFYYDHDVTFWNSSHPSNVPQATWTLAALEAGDYRVAMTWRADEITNQWFDHAAEIKIFVAGSLVSTRLIDQAKRGTIPIANGTDTLYWTLLDEDINVGSGQSVQVQLTGHPAMTLMADAVRLDRLVSHDYQYDQNGNVIQDTDARGNHTNFVYDERNRLTRTITADPDGATPDLASQVTQRTYDGYGNVVLELRGLVTSPAAFRADTFSYDARNRLITTTIDSDVGHENVLTKYEYDAVGNQTLVTDALNHQSHYRYDSLNRVIDAYQDLAEGAPALPTVTPATTQPYGSGLDGAASVASVADVANGVLALSGNAWKSIPINYAVKHDTVLEVDVESNWAAQVHMIGFDTNNVFELGSQERLFELGGITSLPSISNTEFRLEDRPNGLVRLHIPIGQYLAESDKAAGLVIAKLVFVNHDTRPGLSDQDRGYTKFSNIKLFESDEVRTVTTYDARSNVASVQTKSDPRNIKSTYGYDRLGRQLTKTLDAGGSLERKYTTIYDVVGNALVQQTPSGPTTSPTTVQTVHQYDNLYRLTKTTLPDPDGIPGGATGLASDVTSFVYDAVGNLIRQINGEGEITSSAYDAQGRVVIKVDGNGDQTRYRYDSEGNLTSVLDAEQNETTYTYDGLNRQTTETIRALVGSTPTLHTRTNIYSNVGNLAQTIDRIGRVRRYSYDTLDRIKLEEWFANTSDPSADHKLTWAYDDLNRVTKQVDSGPSTNLAITTDDLVDTFAYDGLGRLIAQANYDASSTGRPLVQQTYDYVFQYDAGGFRDRVIRKQSTSANLGIADTVSEYDRLGRLTSVAESDSLAGTTTPQVASKSFTVGYDLAGNLNQLARTAGPTTSFAYDKADRLTSITHDLATDIVHNYAYDNASRVTNFNTNGAGAATRGYGYDEAGQLTSKTGGTTESYAYDDNGNRTGSYVTALANRLTSDGTFSYTYDQEGNITRRTPLANVSITNPVINYGYDHRNRLTWVRSFASIADAAVGLTTTQTIAYTYDAQDRRVQRTIDPDGSVTTLAATSEYFVYEGNDLALRFGNAQELTHRYLYGPLADQVLADEVFIAGSGGQRVSDEVLWQLADHQGTVRDVMDDNGTLRKHVDYDSFGKITGESYYAKNGTSVTSAHAEAVDQLFGYTGQEWDKDAKLQNSNARWYDPAIGRFISEDPSGFDGGDPNFYRYVGNSPLNATDPTGLTQAGNPLNSIFSSLARTPAPLITSTVTRNSYSTAIAASSSLGNSLYNAASSYWPGARAAVGAGVSFAAAGLSLLPPAPEQSYPQNPRMGDLLQRRIVEPTKNFGQSLLSGARNVHDFVTEIAEGFKIRIDETTYNARTNHPSPVIRNIAEGLKTSVSSTSDFVEHSEYQLNFPVRVEDTYRAYRRQNVNSGAALILGLGQNVSIFSHAMTVEELYRGSGNQPDTLERALSEQEKIQRFGGLVLDVQMAGTMAAFEFPKKGNYEFTASSGKKYVGQSRNIPRRIDRHLSTGKLLESDLSTVRTNEVLGGKIQREVAEQLRIDALGGIRGGALENIRNPIGPGRQHLLPPTPPNP